MDILLYIPAIVWLIISAVFYGFGEYLSKIWAMSPSLSFSVFVVFIYSIGTFVWLPALLHKNELAVMGTLWLLFAMLATVSIGVFAFNEKLNYFQIIGIITAIVALVLLSVD